MDQREKPEGFYASAAESASVIQKAPREIRMHRVPGEAPSITIHVGDDPGPGGANHVYVLVVDGHDIPASTIIKFQKGGIAEVGPNGVSIEALLAVCMDRLQSFQKGPFATRENALALTNIEQGLMWLQRRTLDRMARGVEGKEQK